MDIILLRLQCSEIGNRIHEGRLEFYDLRTFLDVFTPALKQGAPKPRMSTEGMQETIDIARKLTKMRHSNIDHREIDTTFDDLLELIETGALTHQLLGPLIERP